MSPMGATDFELRYQRDPDPWRYESSEYERDKYAATLAACGEGRFESALELGGSIGVFSALLASRTRTLTTIDAAPSAVRVAKARLSGLPHVRVVQGSLPGDLPSGPYDLILASEILYYLTSEALAQTLERLRSASEAGTRFVAVHWRPSGPDRWHNADTVHALLRAQPWLQPVDSGHTDQYRLDVLRRR